MAAMKSLLLAVAAISAITTVPAAAADWAIAIHGGAGVIERSRLTPEEDRAYRAGLNEAILAGESVLKAGGSAIDAVQAAVIKLEENPLFNAGHGAVLTADGKAELDAAIMDGATLKAGAVTGVTTTRSPVTLARTLMEKGPPVFLWGPNADAYARANGLPQVENAWFITEKRRQQLQNSKLHGQGAALSDEQRFGTVGAVARDSRGNLAAATSTGGLTGKLPGRIGDAPVIGAGTIADNRSCAVSATGSGEIFIRTRVASQICDRVAFGGQALDQAAAATIADMGAHGGDGGVIVLGRSGNAYFAMNSQGMYRARASSSKPVQIAIYGDETLPD